MRWPRYLIKERLFNSRAKTSLELLWTAQYTQIRYIGCESFIISISFK